MRKMKSKSVVINPVDGLPQINLPHRDYPQLALESNKPYDLQTFEFSNLANIGSLHRGERSLLKKTANNISNDHDLVSIVTLTLLEMIAFIGLKDELHVEKGSFFIDDAWNVLVIRRSSGEEVAVFAVTPSDPDVLSGQSSVQAQVLDYLVKIASYEGQRDVFGGVTSYEQWRFCCLPGTEEVAAADVLLEHLDPLPDDLHVSHLRRLMCSQSYPRTSPDLIYALESLLLRVQASPTLPRPSLLTHTHMYIDLTADRWQWMTVTPDAPMSLLYPSAASVWYTLLRQLRRDRAGTVWLARTDTGAVVVLKVPIRRSWSTAAVEGGLWLRVWGVDVRTVKVMNVPTLELPFVYETCLEEVCVQSGEKGEGGGGVDQGGGEGEGGGEVGDCECEEEGGEEDVVAEKEFGSGKAARRRRHKIRHKHRVRQAKEAATHTTTTTNTSDTNSTTNTTTNTRPHRRRIYFTGITPTTSHTAHTTSHTTSTTTNAELQSVQDTLLRLAADPLGTARRALSVLVSKGHVLCDEDVRWSHLAILPERKNAAQDEGKGCADGCEGECAGECEGEGGVREGPVGCELVLIPIVTALNRLQDLQGDPEQEVDRMVALLEAQLIEEEK